MIQLTRLAVCTLALACFSSCFVSRETTNVPLSAELVDQLEPGRTTATEVAEILGAPSEVVQLGFRSAWRYDHVRAKRAGFSVIVVTLIDTDARTDRVWVFFDENDLLTNVGSTFQAGGSQYQMPWQSRDYPESVAASKPNDESADTASIPAGSGGSAAR
ncbi:MAG: outer membrane protein assembly factor BamE [Planctomycetes bacterium]|nr:outer membrane protein assembly factor BamE [Planctomycetota bacterium]MCB9903364.1 outer membrane protein assembly factor BamE [Planctomycetota bacterium]